MKCPARTGKLIEKLLDSRLKGFCEVNNILTDNQYGFRHRRCTLDAVGRVMRAINEAAGLKNMVGILLLDVRNAFNSAPCRVITSTL